MITSQETRTQRVEAFGLDVQFRVTYGARLYVRNVTKMGCCNDTDPKPKLIDPAPQNLVSTGIIRDWLCKTAFGLSAGIER